MERPRICVVGACNIDLISYVKRLPVLGETLHGNGFRMGFGGKGANQAVMAARLGADVTMIGKLGQDMFGQTTLNNFKKEKINADHVLLTDQAFSGVAPIAVDAEGNNSIIIVTGANDRLSLREIENARQAIAQAQILICQLEIPLEITLAALRIAREEGVTTLFNPAPAKPDLPDEIYRLSDIFCPNETETEILTGRPGKTTTEAETAARLLLARGAKSVILTLGERGSLIVTESVATPVPVDPVKAVDTTGAGDCFVGSLAFFIASGLSMIESIRRANQIASISVQAAGTQTSFPQAHELPAEIFDSVYSPLQTKKASISSARLAGYFDHTLLKPDAKAADFDRLCDEAVRLGFKSVCINSHWVSYVAGRLKGAPVEVCSVIGFPLGAMATKAKVFEARQAVADGATELDMVINIGALKSGNDELVFQDIKAVREGAPAPVLLKVIIETCLLTDDEKFNACEIAQKAGADFVKTSTGFSTGGATVSDVALMRKAVGPGMGVKASGGIKDLETALAMIEAGANRLGASAGVAIVEEAASQEHRRPRL